MKTFDDLIFKPHVAGLGLHAIINFDNGYGVSVIKFNDEYSDGFMGNDKEFEVAILKNDKIDYNNPIADGDVIKYQNKKEVTKIMEQIQNL